MIQIEKIQNELLHLVGFKQEVTAIEGAVVSENLTESTSGMYFQQEHPLITLDNLYNIAPDFTALEDKAVFVNAQIAKSNTAYSKDTVVLSSGRMYKAKQDIEPMERIMPINEPSLFAETNLFSEWLESKVKGSIAKVINRFINEKYANAITRPLLENKTLFDGTGRLSDTIENKNKIVGFEIVPIRVKGIVTKINKIGLQFTEPGEYTLYLMHSSSVTPISTIQVTKKKKGFEWVSVDNLLLSYEGESNDAGGSWYLCYRQNELPEGSKAINKNKDWSKGPCKSCSRSEYASWQAWSKFIEVHPFEVHDSDEDMALWDIDENDYTYSMNWGINLDISIYCDLTDFIIQEKSMFTGLIMKQFAIDMLREFAYNPNVRTNRHTISASRMDILYELDGDSSSMKKSGLAYQLDQAYKAVNLSTQGIDRVCLPCKNNGIKYRTI